MPCDLFRGLSMSTNGTHIFWQILFLRFLPSYPYLRYVWVNIASGGPRLNPICWRNELICTVTSMLSKQYYNCFKHLNMIAVCDRCIDIQIHEQYIKGTLYSPQMRHNGEIIYWSFIRRRKNCLLTMWSLILWISAEVNARCWFVDITRGSFARNLHWKMTLCSLLTSHNFGNP